MVVAPDDARDSDATADDCVRLSPSRTDSVHALASTSDEMATESSTWQSRAWWACDVNSALCHGGIDEIFSSVEGRCLYRLHLTKRVFIFAIVAADGTVVDCICRVQDGWSAQSLDELDAALGQAGSSTLVVTGSLETLHSSFVRIVRVLNLSVAGRTWQAARETPTDRVGPSRRPRLTVQ